MYFKVESKERIEMKKAYDKTKASVEAIKGRKDDSAHQAGF
jgi:hypothetical protein